MHTMIIDENTKVFYIELSEQAGYGILPNDEIVVKNKTYVINSRKFDFSSELLVPRLVLNVSEKFNQES